MQNANDMADCLAATLSGEMRGCNALPRFWSTQYDLRLQTIGLSIGHDQAVLRGRIAERSFSILYLKQNRVIALEGVNTVKDFVQGRVLIESRTEIPAADLANVTFSLRDIAAANALRKGSTAPP